MPPTAIRPLPADLACVSDAEGSAAGGAMLAVLDRDATVHTLSFLSKSWAGRTMRSSRYRVGRILRCAITPW